MAVSLSELPFFESVQPLPRYWGLLLDRWCSFLCLHLVLAFLLKVTVWLRVLLLVLQRVSQSYSYFTQEEIEDLCTTCGLVNYTSKVQQSFIMFTAQKPWYCGFDSFDWYPFHLLFTLLFFSLSICCACILFAYFNYKQYLEGKIINRVLLKWL